MTGRLGAPDTPVALPTSLNCSLFKKSLGGVLSGFTCFPSVLKRGQATASYM